MLFKTKTAIFETIYVFLLAAMILSGIFWVTDYRKFVDLETSIAVQDVLIKQLQETIVDYELRIMSLEDKNVLLITSTGREIVLETLGGQTLRCYFPAP